MTESRLISKVLPVLFFLLGAGLAYLFFNRFDWNELYTHLKQSHWQVIGWVAPVSISVYLLRTYRWKKLIHSSGDEVSFLYLLGNLSISYVLSFFIPRAGEILRISFLYTRYQIPVTKSAGIVFTERISDVFILLICLGIFPWVAGEKIYAFFNDFILKPLGRGISPEFLTLFLLLGLCFFLIVFLWILKKVLRRTWSDQFRQGILAIKKPGLQMPFLLSTAGIWMGYFLLTWIWFFAFEETKNLAISQVFLVFVIGTVGRSVPIQGGGAGAYHWLVAQGLAIFGISALTSTGLAFLIHGAQTIFTFIMGLPFLMAFRILQKKP